jgi:hypothetical protein
MLRLPFLPRDLGPRDLRVAGALAAAGCAVANQGAASVSLVPEPSSALVPRVRWGIPDAVVAWLVGLVVSVLAVLPFSNADGQLPRRDEAIALGLAAVAQNLGTIGWIFGVAYRKGLGSPRLDFGLVGRFTDVLWVPAGVVLAFVATVAVLPIVDLANVDESTQRLVEVFERSGTTVEHVIFVVGVLMLAPIGEELLFRGVLLRGLQRRMSTAAAVITSAVIFALVHLGDPGTGYYMPAYVLLGLVLGWLAVSSRRLGPSIAVHAGFNLVAVLTILT